MSSHAIRVHVHPALREVAPEFLARARGQAQDMGEGLASGNLERVAAIAHQLAGAGRTFAMPLVSELGFDLERGAKRGDVERVRASLAALTDYLSKVEIV
jgi:HPt (histidine-containing phosphotransfer) domain-containing protein